MLKTLNVELKHLPGDNRFTFPDPATSLIDTDGSVSCAFVPNNYRRPDEVDDILHTLNQLVKN